MRLRSARELLEDDRACGASIIRLSHVIAPVLVLVLAVGCSPSAPRAKSTVTIPASPPARATPRARPASFTDALERLCTGPSSVPMEIAGSREFVQVALPGASSSESLRFHVDTGGNTPGLMLDASVAERLGFRTAEAMPRSIRIGAREIPLPSGSRWTLVDRDEPSSKFSRATRKDFAVGQIGAGFLSRFALCVDPGHARLGLGDPGDLDADAGDVKWVPLLLMAEGSNRALYPFVHILLRERRDGAFAGGYGVLLDTGATTSMLDRNKIEYQHRKHPSWGFAEGAFGDADMLGGQYTAELIRAPDVAFHTAGPLHAYGLHERVSIDLGPATFVDRPTGTWERMFGHLDVTAGSHGAIANDVLLRYRIVLDYRRRRLFAEPSGLAPDESASSTRIGVAVRFADDGCPEVRQVTDTNAPETRARIHVGDEIMSIDGADACKMYHHEVARALAGPAGALKKLTIRRGPTTLDVEVPTAELLHANP
jgi:hypothetical protein